MSTLAAIALGGAAGAVARYLATGWVQDVAGGFFPWGTLAVNVAGSLLLGFVLAWLQSTVASTELRALVTIGFLGSFTTFSTFAYEAWAMLQDQEWVRAGGYLMGSVVMGLLGLAAGAALATSILRTGSGS